SLTAASTGPTEQTITAANGMRRRRDDATRAVVIKTPVVDTRSDLRCPIALPFENPLRLVCVRVPRRMSIVAVCLLQRESDNKRKVPGDADAGAARGCAAQTAGTALDRQSGRSSVSGWNRQVRGRAPRQHVARRGHETSRLPGDVQGGIGPAPSALAEGV